MFWAKKSYFRRIFDLRHFYGPDDNLYHPTDKRPANRLKTAKSGMARKNRVEFHNATRLQPFVMIDLHCNGKDMKTGRISQRGRSVLYEKII